MVLTQLSMFPGEESCNDSVAAQNGMNKQRIKTLFAKKFCSCSKACHKALSVQLVVDMCKHFWSLPKSGQDCILWGMQNMGLARKRESSDEESSDSGSSDQKAINSWYIQGRAVDSVRLSASLMAGRHPDLQGRLLQKFGDRNLEAREDAQHVPGRRPTKV